MSYYVELLCWHCSLHAIGAPSRNFWQNIHGDVYPGIATTCIRHFSPSRPKTLNQNRHNISPDADFYHHRLAFSRRLPPNDDHKSTSTEVHITLASSLVTRRPTRCLRQLSRSLSEKLSVKCQPASISVGCRPQRRQPRASGSRLSSCILSKIPHFHRLLVNRLA